jgi:hypothetical protein
MGEVQSLVPRNEASESDEKMENVEPRSVRVSMDSTRKPPRPNPVHSAWQRQPAHFLGKDQEDWKSVLSLDAVLDSPWRQVANSSFQVAGLPPPFFAARPLQGEEGKPRRSEVWRKLREMDHLVETHSWRCQTN